MTYTHVLNRGGLGVRSPLDRQPRVSARAQEESCLRSSRAEAKLREQPKPPEIAELPEPEMLAKRATRSCDNVILRRLVVSWADPQPRSSGSSDELANIHAYVTCDGAEKSRRDVSTLVERNRRHATIRMSILAVRTTLANLNEPKTREDGDDLPSFRTGTSPIA